MKLKREIIIGIALVLIIILAAVWYWGNRTTVLLNQSPTGSSISPSTSAGPPAPVSLNESGQYYDIVASYPSATSLKQSASAGADANAVAAMKQFEEGTIVDFKTQGNFANLSANDIKTLGLAADNKESLKITYTSASGPHTISYIYAIVEDTLGAHPNTTYKTFTFDTTTGTYLSLANLFTTNADYLATLSTATRSSLPKTIASREQVSLGNIDTGSLNSGTAPTSDNFANWYIDTGNLVIIFPPYQVAAYTAGEIEVPLPLAMLPGVAPSYK